MILLLGLWTFVRAMTLGSAALALENVALRHQLAILQRSVRRPQFHRWDRAFWVGLSRWWRNWRASLVIVQPATVISWHRQGFALYWRWKSRPRAGRPPIDRHLRELIRRMARENPTWGRRRIQAELHFLGYDVAELTVAKYMRRPRSPRPSPTWRSFLQAHLKDIAAIDFFVVPTLTFRLLFGFIVLCHDRRELVHISVTDHPTAQWTAQQIVDAFPYDAAPRYLLRDRDAIYGAGFTRRIAGLGMRELLIAARAPWQNPFAECLIGSLRRECLDHFLVVNERHLRRLLHAYVAYYNTVRPHQALHNDSPRPRAVHPPALGTIVAIPLVASLHHRYQRAA